jgi:tetratricopeptide (TPR) repeat protein
MSMHRPFIAAALAGLLITGCSKDPEQAKREYFDSGQDYLKQKKVAEAIVQFKNAVQQDPRFGEARLALAKALEESGDVRSAYGEYVRAADLMPQDLEAHLSAGRMQLLAGRFDDAKALAEKSLAIDPKSVEAHMLEGGALSGLKQFDAAMAEVQTAIALDPTRADTVGTLAMMHVAQGRNPEAEAAFKLAIELAPGKPEPRIALATFYLTTGQSMAAEAALNEALAVMPNDVLVHKGLAAVYMRTGQAQKAEAPLKFIADQTKDPASMMALADYYRVSLRNDEALPLLSTIAATQPKMRSAALARKAAIQRSQDQRAEAYGTIEEALKHDPKDVTVLALKAQYQLADDRLEDALASAQQLVRDNPSAFQAHFVLGAVHQRRGSAAEAISAFTEALKYQPRDVATQARLSTLSLVVGKPRDALKFAQEATQAAPNSADAWLAYTRAQMASGDLAGAEQRLKAIAAQLPEVSEVHAQLGELHATKKDRKAARAAYERALALDATSVVALSGLTGLEIEEQNAPAARRRVDAAVAARPQAAHLLMLAARVYNATGDPATAEGHLRRVVELEPGNLMAYGQLAQVYIGQNRLDAAIQEYEKQAARTAKSVGPTTLVGMLLEAQKKPEEARKRYEQALSLDPSAPVPANNLAWMLAEKGENLDQAMQLALTAKAGLPDSVEVSDTLGWVYYKKGLYSRAVAMFKEAVDKQPSNADLTYHLGLAYAKNGDTRLAKEHLESALRARPESPLASDARTALGQLASGS